MVGRLVGGLKARVGREGCIGRGGRMDQIEHNGVQAGGAQRGRQSVGRCGTSRRNRDATRSGPLQE